MWITARNSSNRERGPGQRPLSSIAREGESVPIAFAPAVGGERIAGDYVILAVYFAFLLGIGWVLKEHRKKSTDLFKSGRSLPLRICALGFIGASLGAQEVVGVATFGAKYRFDESHFYWVGTSPAMVFVGIFVKPFY